MRMTVYSRVKYARAAVIVEWFLNFFRKRETIRRESAYKCPMKRIIYDCEETHVVGRKSKAGIIVGIIVGFCAATLLYLLFF